ncbi:hypothetical protein P152DRAFT_106018 [Eremomyces bilateralis CBS 781.70]|uniref:Uncharacterized protein n=1 Tax=Eremomyces bilateralis CBS 781.70 TaxID=1392243 RepID=A0A6G1FWZ1_9PEZI|nr:uncharacterized protein P152DRAFT_106018 [Eremomyces bilateralis CBS 781.70]KAF1810258.1 hypothetical protein P152DRAFT_106018 [Eremomyces bilateralis CBS 781.70]
MVLPVSHYVVLLFDLVQSIGIFLNYPHVRSLAASTSSQSQGLEWFVAHASSGISRCTPFHPAPRFPWQAVQSMQMAAYRKHTVISQSRLRLQRTGCLGNEYCPASGCRCLGREYPHSSITTAYMIHYLCALCASSILIS